MLRAFLAFCSLILWTPALVLAQAQNQPTGPAGGAGRPVNDPTAAGGDGGSWVWWIVVALIVLAIIWWAAGAGRRRRPVA